MTNLIEDDVDKKKSVQIKDASASLSKIYTALRTSLEVLVTWLRQSTVRPARN